MLAARMLGMDTVPVIELSHLTKAQKQAYIIADNRLALNAGWDNEMLTVELNELLADGFDLDVLGFDTEDLQKLLDKPNFEPATLEEQGKLDQLDPKWIACPHCGKEFDAREA
jgi:ParB family transcriptional regulator, chromosome partitioning protein